jgi:hypothetical protein
MDTIDRDALERSIEIVRNESPAQRKRIDDRLASGKDWERVAGSCAIHYQHTALDLMPWQLAPLHYANHLDNVLREHFGDPSGRREAGEVLKKLLALGLSRLEPNPLQGKRSSVRLRSESRSCHTAHLRAFTCVCSHSSTMTFSCSKCRTSRSNGSC